PQELGVDADRPVLGVLDPAQIGCREVHERILPEQSAFLAQRGAVADARTIREGALEPAHHGEEIEPPRFPRGFLQEGGQRLCVVTLKRGHGGNSHLDGVTGFGGGFVLVGVEQVHSGRRSPMRVGHRMISPRSTERMIVWVKWLSAAYSAKK